MPAALPGRCLFQQADAAWGRGQWPEPSLCCLDHKARFLCSLLQLSIEQAQTVAEQVEMKAKVVQSEVKAVTARHKKALEERECELLWKVRGYPHHYIMVLVPTPGPQIHMPEPLAE